MTLRKRANDMVDVGRHPSPKPPRQDHVPSEDGTFYKLLTIRRFLPLFVTQFLTSLNDNFFKNALVAMLTYGIFSQSYAPETQQLLVILAGATFVLPYLLVSATAGKIADKFPRLSIVRWIKIAEMLMMVAGAVGFMLGNVPVLFAVLFALGIHSSMFSPVKFGIMPTYLHQNQLIAGNALIEAATFLAIVMGTILGTQIVLIPQWGAWLSAIFVLIMAVAGFVAYLYMPAVRPVNPSLSVSWNIFADTWEVMRDACRYPELMKYILACSWFWFVAAVMMTIFPLYVKMVLNLDHNIYTILLVIFSIGVGVGSAACSWILKDKISAAYTPLAALGMALFAIELGMISRPFHDGEGLGTVAIFFADPESWRVAFDFLAIAAFGGFYVVPFFTLIQDRAPRYIRSRMIGANNIVNACAMILGASFMYLIKTLGIGLAETLMIIGGMCAVGSLVLHFVIEDSIFRRRRLK